MTPLEALELLWVDARRTREHEAAFDAISSLLRRDWAVRVLVELLRRGHITYTGFPVAMLSQPETMRIAKERLHHLSPEVRTELGECP